MTTIIYRGDDAIPIEVGGIYRLSPGSTSGQWVEIIAIVRGDVYVRGLDNTIASWCVPIKRFDDLVGDYLVGEYFLVTEDLYEITTELDAQLAYS